MSVRVQFRAHPDHFLRRLTEVHIDEASGLARLAAPIARACKLTVQIEPNLHERRVGALGGTPR